MKIVTSGGKKKVIMSKDEWTRIGLIAGFIPTSITIPEMEKYLKLHGFEFKGQKGSHMHYEDPTGKKANIVNPDGKRQLIPQRVKQTLQSADLPLEDFLDWRITGISKIKEKKDSEKPQQVKQKFESYQDYLNYKKNQAFQPAPTN